MDEVFDQAMTAAQISDAFNAAREESVKNTSDFLILVDTEDGLLAWTNCPGPHSGFMAAAYHVKAITEAYPTPLEDQDD